jgi:cysteine desulfurase/selenocysteine lyase
VSPGHPIVASGAGAAQPPLDVAKLRADFPILARRVHGKPLVYLDNAATTQKPLVVLERLNHFYRQTNANIHRGIHRLAEEATALYEETRGRTARFLGATDPRGVVFTSGTTGALNLLASSWGHWLRPGDEILLTEMEHHSNLVPWFLAAKERGAQVRHIPVTDGGRLDLTRLGELLTDRTRIVSLTQVSNVLGTINPIRVIADAAHAVGALVSVDAAQGAPHHVIDVQELGCDALSFSAHKVLGPTGVGVLWVKPDLLERMEPYQGGGEMIREVRMDGATWAEIPHRFEAGTPNIAGVVALGPALDYVERLGYDAIGGHGEALTAYALERLRGLGGLRLLGPMDPAERSGAISFADAVVHPHDLSTVLDQEGVAIRAGHHCAQPLHRRYGLVATARASFYIYNDRDDVDALVAAIESARRYFG